ncbi:MAG: penicillin-binding protein 1B, partial [Chromatiales bacterium]
GLTGSAGAMRIWADLMRRVGVAHLEERPPIGIELVAIDPKSGLMGEGCKDARITPFFKGSGPKRVAPCARGSLMDDGLLWLQRLME